MKTARWMSAWILLAMALLPVESMAGEWGLGLGVVSQRPPQAGADSEVFVIPFPSYEGERLSASLGNVNWALHSSERFRVAVEGQVRFDGYDPDSSTGLAGMEERDATVDVGFSFTARGSWGVARLQAVGDVFGVHEGYEISTGYEHPFQAGRWVFLPSLTVSFLSEDLVDYYYGVRLDESMPGRPAYAGASTINTKVGLTVAYSVSQHWSLVAGGEYVRLGREITDSPIIARDHQLLTYTAVEYRF